MLMQNISADRCGEEVGGLKMNARNILAKKREFMIVLSAIALIACLLSGCGSSTGAHAGIIRLDDEGYLYYMDYTKDYYGKDVMDAMRKVGFIDSDGNVLIAPADMIFPTEMRDGNLYIFSTDIDATKKKLAEEAQNSPQFFPQTNEQSAFPQRNASAPNTFVPMPGQSGQLTQNAPGSQIAGQAVNQVSGQVPGQTSQQTPEQTFPGAKNGEWAYNPENPQNDGRSPDYPRRGQQGNAQQATDQTGDTQQAGSQLGNSQQKLQPSGTQQPGGYPQQQGQRGNSQSGLPGMPNRDQNGNVIPSYSPQQGTSGETNPGTPGKVPSSSGNDSNIVNKKPIMFQCYLA